MAKMPKPEEMIASRASFPEKSWMDVKTEIKAGMYAYPAKVDIMEGLHMPHPHAWQPEEEDWHLPENWEEIIYKALKERLAKHRSLKIFMDTCVRCGACADKCHFFLGTNDPKNMPVLRAELLRSVYRRDFTTAGRLLGKVAGARKLTTDVIKEWFTYFYQCTECRRCSLFCPYGIDTAEITAIVRELLHELGLGINWIMEPVSNCNRTGNHLGIQPHAFKEIVEFLCEDIETITGIHIDPPFNEKGHEILFITPSGDVFAEPGIYTFMGYLMLFHELGLDYTLSTYASEGGNFGSFVSFDMAKKLNAKMYAEAKRLGSKWIDPVGFHGLDLAGGLVGGVADGREERRTLAGVLLLLFVVVAQVAGTAGGEHGHADERFHGRAELVAEGTARVALHHDHVVAEIKPQTGCDHQAVQV